MLASAILETVDASEIVQIAAARGAVKGLNYAGEITPTEAYQLFKAGLAKIVDVRSSAEPEFVGYVPGAIHITWKFWPSGELNSRFIDELAAQVQPQETLLLLCRSAARSHAAATKAAAAGYAHAFNILEGFEGTIDAAGQRGHINGWKKASLPWNQS